MSFTLCQLFNIFQHNRSSSSCELKYDFEDSGLGKHLDGVPVNSDKEQNNHGEKNEGGSPTRSSRKLAGSGRETERYSNKKNP